MTNYFNHAMALLPTKFPICVSNKKGGFLLIMNAVKSE